MIPRYQIESLIPHKGSMCLWDMVLDWSVEKIVLQAGNHRDIEHPLRSDGKLRALHLCEYGAQAMAVHGGLCASGSGGAARPGLLVALRGVNLHIERIDMLPGMLICEARVLVQTIDSQQYEFRIRHQDQLLAEGRAVVILQTPMNAQ